MEEAVGTPREHLVGIALMTDIEDDLVLGGVEDIVEGNRRLHEAEVRAYMTTMVTHTVEDSLTDLTGYVVQFFDIESLDIFRTLDFL